MKLHLSAILLALTLGIRPAFVHAGQGKTCRQKIQSLFSRSKAAIQSSPAMNRVNQVRAHTNIHPRLSYLHYMATRSTAMTWDQTRLTKAIKKLHERGALSTEKVLKILQDPDLPHLSKYLKLDPTSGKLILTGHKSRIQKQLIDKIISQVSHQEEKLAQREGVEWETFFQKAKLNVEELRALQRELTHPIHPSKITLYQSYIHFAQTYRLSNNGLIVSTFNRIIPGNRKRTSLDAIKYINQIESIDFNASVPTRIWERGKKLFKRDPPFLKKFRGTLMKVKKYRKKTLKKEIAKRESNNKQNLLSREKIESNAKKATAAKTKIYQKLYMGCRSMRNSDIRKGNFKRFALFFMGIGLVIDGATYINQTPEGGVTKFSPEYFRQISLAMKNSRWRKVLSYELAISLAFSASSGLFISNPLISPVEKSVLNYGRTRIMGVMDGLFYHGIFNESSDHIEKFFDQLISHENFEQFHGRIWEIVENAGLKEEFQLALEQAMQEDLKNSGPHVIKQGQINMETLRHPAIKHVLKEVPARMAEKQEMLEGIDVELYANLKGIDYQTAFKEIQQILNDPKQRAAIHGFKKEIQSTGLVQKLREVKKWLVELFNPTEAPDNTFAQTPALSSEMLQYQRVREVFLEAMADAIYRAQAGELIQTGNMGTDRFVFYSTWGTFAAFKSIAVGTYLYRILCMGQGSAYSYIHASMVKIVENLLFQDIHWMLRNCAIGKAKHPEFDDIFNPSAEKEDYCQNIFFKDEKELIGQLMERAERAFTSQ